VIPADAQCEARKAAVEAVRAAIYDPDHVGPRVQGITDEFGALAMLESLVWVAATLMDTLRHEQAHPADPEPLLYACERIVASLKVCAGEQALG
jgi:hypothetical protein